MLAAGVCAVALRCSFLFLPAASELSSSLPLPSSSLFSRCSREARARDPRPEKGETEKEGGMHRLVQAKEKTVGRRDRVSTFTREARQRPRARERERRFGQKRSARGDGVVARGPWPRNAVDATSRTLLSPSNPSGPNRSLSFSLARRAKTKTAEIPVFRPPRVASPPHDLDPMDGDDPSERRRSIGKFRLDG